MAFFQRLLWGLRTMRVLRRNVGASGLFGLGMIVTSGCGVIYTPQKVYEPDGVFGDENLSYRVELIALDRPAIREANAVSYAPRALPSAYQSVSGGEAARAVETVNAAFAERGYSGARERDAGVGPAPQAAVSQPKARISVTPSAPASASVPRYRIGVGDVVTLSSNTKNVTDFGGVSAVAAQAKRSGFVVQDDGAIAVPEIGEISLRGLTIDEARDSAFDAFLERGVDPTFTLEISEFNSRRAAIGGLVNQPTLIPIALQPISVAEAIAAAGGLRTPLVDDVIVRLLRNGRLYEDAARRILDGRSRLGDAVLLDRDAVFVDTAYNQEQAQQFFAQQLSLRSQRRADLEYLERRRRSEREAFQERLALGAVERDLVYVTGAVQKPGVQQLPFERRATLAMVLFENGGLSAAEGDPSDIYVLRQDAGTGQVLAYHLDAANALQMPLMTEFEMRPNDMVFVETQPITDWARGGEPTCSWFFDRDLRRCALEPIEASRGSKRFSGRSSAVFAFVDRDL